MAEITIESADGTRQRFHLWKERVTVGRARSCDVFLPDQWLSRQHAEIRRRSGDYYVADLESKNGTLLNGERLGEERRLRHGDVISLGEHHLTFSTVDEPAREEEPEEAPEGTRVFSARDLSDVKTRPTIDPEELQRQNRILTVLKDGTEALLAHRPLPELFETILDLLMQAVPAQRAAILLLEGNPPQTVVTASRSRQGEKITKVSRSIARRVLEGLDSLLIPNILEDAAFRAQDSILATGIRTAMCAPLWFRSADAGADAVIGLVYLDSLLGAEPFGEEDLRIVTALANVAAAKIENARLLEESLEKRRMEEDMAMAAEIQRGLLPSASPAVPGYGVCGVNFPCRTVGGDYFDFMMEDGQLLFALGDVSGKGTGAALLMTVLRAAVRAHWAERPTAQAVARINRTVCQNIPTNKYVTFFMGSLEPETGLVSYVNAGHNPPLLVRTDGSVDTLAEGGMVLGFVDPTEYGEGRAELRPGDMLVVFSDGVTETWSAADEEYGETRLAELLVRERGLGPRELQAALLSELDHFSRGTKATDDRTLIVIKRLPA
ncbi:MAG TPA: SpoIIE family protein phosphatase [Vicinamibacteria bacterium]|nr:SpoIIE family protein phosphatase [Vicinamibacteria bacterium]